MRPEVNYNGPPMERLVNVDRKDQKIKVGQRGPSQGPASKCVGHLVIKRARRRGAYLSKDGCGDYVEADTPSARSSKAVSLLRERGIKEAEILVDDARVQILVRRIGRPVQPAENHSGKGVRGRGMVDPFIRGAWLHGLANNTF